MICKNAVYAVSNAVWTLGEDKPQDYNDIWIKPGLDWDSPVNAAAKLLA
jgi:hypothetical protein